MKVFIIAGVGDHTGYIVKHTKDWKQKYDLEPVPLKFGWRGDYANNYLKLKKTIVELADREAVAVIGISAGGSAALRLASELNDITKVVTICARTSRGGFKTLSLESFPAYWDSVDALSNVRLDKKVLVIKPWFDEIVSVKHMDYDNAEVLSTPHLLHIPSVLGILSKRSDAIASFMQR